LKLYELSQNYVTQLLELADSLDQETFQDTLSSLEEAIEDKAENVAKLIKCLDSDCKAIKEEEQRLADRRKALENKISSIKEYLTKSNGGSWIKQSKATNYYYQHPS
jgi:predicted  nucleic acid-binding Zn-ribbon protein